ncbi:MAG: hypothetical protein IJE89_00455 [Bacilli bacterium]|nr:hypothetical protein [Bacilli bacterium]
MSKKKLEVVELNKKEEKIILEEKLNPWNLFWKKYGQLVYLTSLILSITILIISLFIFVSNLFSSDHPTIKEVSIDVDINSSSVTLDSQSALTDETATNTFNNNSIFKSNGEVLEVKTIEEDLYILKFYSDFTVIKIMKNQNIVTRINSLDEYTYGIDENGVLNSKAIISDTSIISTKNYPWGKVNFYKDGSAEIFDSKINLFVRNSKDIEKNYISNNKVSYLKETKDINNIKLNYYYDGTIEVIKDNKSYLVRNENDLDIKSNNVTFKNNNESTIRKTINLSDGCKIDYYTDGGAIITDGENTISVRKSNSIIIKDNKIYEIVDNIYVEVSNTKDNGNVTYYTNGGAVIKDYNGKTLYTPENSYIKYKKDNRISNVTHSYEKLTEQRTIEKDKITKFETVAVVETEKFIAIVPKDNILYDSDGSLKEILVNEIENTGNPIIIENNTNELINYRVVIEKSSRTNLDIEYIKYQLSVGDTYISPTRLDSKIWKYDNLADGLSITGTNYILLDKELEPHAKDEIKLMLWTDYEKIPNSMQDKYFYGTIKVYAWKDLK